MEYVIRERIGGLVLASGVLGETVQMLEGCWYFAPETVNMEHLRVSKRIYTCPYKGICHWIDLSTPRIHAQSVAWVYEDPKPGYEMIKGHIGFSNNELQNAFVIETH